MVVFGQYLRRAIDCNEWKTETSRMHKYEEIKTTQIMMSTECHATSSSGIRKFWTDEFLLDWVYTNLSSRPPAGSYDINFGVT
jgi:hypothetical protein